MVARPAPRPFSPEAPSRIAVAHDGTLAAIVEPTRVVVVDLPDGKVQSEIGLDPKAETIDVAWIASPPRLLVLARFAAHSMVHLIDPCGPVGLADIRLESPLRLTAAIGSHALLVGGPGAAILTLADTLLVPYQFQSRATPAIAGTAGSMFVVALAGTLEEWDPISRMPKRRLRLPRPIPITALGGSERLVWMTTQHEPARVDVLPLVNRGQPKLHDLPDAITAVAGHPRSDLLACVAGGRLYVVDLDGRTRLRTIATDGLDHVDAAALVVGRSSGILVAQTGRPLAFHILETREDLAAPPRPPRLDDDGPAKRSTLAEEPEPAPSSLRARMMGAVEAPVRAPIVEAAELAPPIPAIEEPARPRAAWTAAGTSLSDRLAAMRTKPAEAPLRSSWRDDAVLWAKAITAGTYDKTAPLAPPIEALASAFEVPQLVPALVLLYGAHLAGLHGVAPVDVSRVLGRAWNDALGRGPLAALGLAGYESSRVILAPAIQRALDELAPATGALVGERTPPTLLGPCTVISDEPLAAIAARLAPQIGPVLAAYEHASLAELVLEARVRDATPLARYAGVIPPTPIVLAVGSREIADELSLPVL